MTKLICALTGSRGYVGGCIRSYFEARNWDVLELVRRSTDSPGRVIPYQLGSQPSPESLAGVSVLVHCAYDFSAYGWEEVREVNVEGTRKLLASAHSAGVEKVVFISTISAYEGCRSLYGRAKLEIEKIAFDAGALVIRPGLVYGVGEGGMFGRLVGQVRGSRVIPIVGDGSQRQFLVHCEDLAALIERYARGETEAPARPVTAAHEQSWALRQLIHTIAQAMGKKPLLVPVPWRFVWAGLRSAEAIGLRLQFRSDSVVSLVYQDPKPDFSANREIGASFRPFGAEALAF